MRVECLVIAHSHPPQNCDIIFGPTAIIYLILNFIYSVFISHKMTDVSSDPVKRYCDCCGTIIDVIAPL